MNKAVKSVKCLLAIALLGAMAYSPVRGQSLQRYLDANQFTHIQAIDSYDSSLFVLCPMGKANPLYSTAGTLYKLNPSLHFTDSVNLKPIVQTFGSTQEVYFNDLIVSNHGNIYLQLTVRDFGNTNCFRAKRTTLILKFSQNLQLLRSVKLGSVDTAYESYELSLNKGSLYSYGLFYKCNQTSPYFRGYVVKLDTSLQITGQNYFKNDSLNLQVRPIINWGIPYQNGHILHPFLTSFSLALLDSNFQYLRSCAPYDSAKLSGIYYRDYRLIELDSGRLGMFGVTSTEYSSPQLHYNVGFKRLDPITCRSTIDTFPFLGAVDFDDVIMPWLKSDCFTKHSNDSLLFAVTSHSDSFITEDSTAIFFYNYNFKQGRLNWMKKMESPYFVWPDVALEALPDGRYVVGLTEFNPDRYPQYTRSLAGRLMIIDAQGQALDNRDIRPAPQQNWSLFPNPATNSVRIKGLPQRPQKLQYTLYSTLGQAVQKGSFTTDHPHIQLPVPTGLYHLQLRHPQAQLGSRALQVLERR
jgi:hypothetical protein